MADFFLAHSYLVGVFPLCSFLVIGLGSFRLSRRLAAGMAVAMAALSCATALAVAFSFFRTVLLHPDQFPARTLVATQQEWLRFTPGLTASMGVYLDPIAVMMMVVVTVIALLVNIYSIGYLRDDDGFVRFFALLALFVFSMLGLVVATNIFQMFVFWELVGVSSYSLIGFWYHKPSAVAASKKAFIVTRFADAFFLLGIVLVGYLAGSFDFGVLNDPATAARLNRAVSLPFLGGVSLLTVATLLIYTGGWGKSAMFPLHIWLPDAMEGPTPVSSIIHSATMVVAGVYLTARMFPLFAGADFTLTVVRSVGAFTALFAAVIAIAQTDIKRILAFSTLSQLGYMMFSLGAARMSGEHAGMTVNTLGYSAAMFHIFTHAFFKCLLFLGAGVIIHAVHSNEIGAMGGLRRRLPVSYWTMLAACLAISGVFPLAGFWSKDEILLAAWQSGHYLTFAVGYLVSGLTALYMFRFFFLIFHGAPRSKGHRSGEDWLMTLPMLALAVPTVAAGLAGKDFFSRYVQPVAGPEQAHLAHPPWLPYAASLAGLAGIGLAWLLYGRGSFALATALKNRLGPVHRLVYNRFYIDELYLFVTQRLIFQGIAEPVKWFDRKVVDGTMDLCGQIIQWGGAVVRRLQNGSLPFYLGVALFGLVLFSLAGHLL